MWAVSLHQVCVLHSASDHEKFGPHLLSPELKYSQSCKQTWCFPVHSRTVTTRRPLSTGMTIRCRSSQNFRSLLVDVNLSDGPEESIQVLDLEKFKSQNSARVDEFCSELRRQCHEIGFFYVKNHGVPGALCESMLRMGRAFFDLPIEVKEQTDYTNSAQFRGYMRNGVENTAGIQDFREQIEFGPEEPLDVDVIDGKVNKLVYPLLRRLRGPNQWSSELVLPGFREKTELFVKEMNQLAMRIMQALAMSLGLDRSFFDPSFLVNPHFQMKVVKYPPQPESAHEQDVKMFGVGAHSDSGFLSLLLQDDIGGLQAQSTSGKWIDVPPVPGTFVVNLGEMLQVATGGCYLATVHRVVSQSGDRSRYSVPFFFNPRLDTDMRTLWREQKGLEVQTHRTPIRVPTHAGKNKLLPIFGQNAFKSFARSHSDVLRLHHPDLCRPDGSFEPRSLEHGF